uniref:alpha-amylase n=1 Tax=Enchytraeus albidus TaxID=6390 RepID=A0AA49X7E4_9ANNE|nr:alpha-amylase II [Enchytraeus albidus]WLK78496.1 alpha-amylase II [Enchytraeus albidus]
MKSLVILLVGLTLAGPTNSQYFGTYYCQSGRDVVVHLFEWKWADIQSECSWLAEHGYCAVQVSPPMEHRIVTDPPYPWWQRYQPVSYSMNSRSGSEQQFRDMVEACNDLGVYIYIDDVINHMTGGGAGVGSDGSSFDGDARDYPGVPFGPFDFNGPEQCPTASGEIEDYGDPIQVRNCMLVGLRDLRGGTAYVQDQTAGYMNKLIDWGVAGFRLDAAKHMWPADVSDTFAKLHDLNAQWFPSGTKAYVYQEVIDWGSEAVSGSEYTGIGRVTEFRHGKNIGDVVRKNFGQRMSYLSNYGEGWGQLNGLDAFVFIDNHDTQRTGDLNSILTFRQSNMYKIANAFQLAWQYGHVRIMSSYYWQQDIQDGRDHNEWIGPPGSGGSTSDVVCFDGDWICEHRWRQISNMVRFHNVALGYPVSNWWDNGGDRIAFGRSGRGFIVINNENGELSQSFSTGLPEGQYCDVITCDNNRPPCGDSGGACRGEFSVDGSGQALITVPAGEDPMVALHV